MTGINKYLEALQSVIADSEGIIYPADRTTIQTIYQVLEADPKSQLVHEVLSTLKGVRKTAGLYKESEKPQTLLTMAIVTLEEIARTQ